MVKNKFDFWGLGQRNWLQTFSEGESTGEKTESKPKTETKPKEEKKVKTFTQEEVSKMMAREKEQGRNSVFNQLGLDPANEAQAEQLKAVVSALFTDNTPAEDQLPDTAKQLVSKYEEKATEAERKAMRAEAKYLAISNGVDPNYVDDVITLAETKATDDKTIESVIKEMKDTHKIFFSQAAPQSSGGTGGSVGHGQQRTKKEPELTYGQRLARAKKG